MDGHLGVTATPKSVILDLISEDNSGEWVEAAEDSLSAIAGVRSELAGDLPQAGMAPRALSRVRASGWTGSATRTAQRCSTSPSYEIQPGVVLRVLEREPFGGPLWVEVGGQRRAMGTPLTHLVHGVVEP
jgi:hypothetical protein